MNDSSVIQCGSWEEFISEVRPLIAPLRRVFRGQRDPSWGLSSKWEREAIRWKTSGDVLGELFATNAAARNSYLTSFKDLASGLPGTNTSGLTDMQWWMLGRHHGLLTPLLDWSFSPYVAAFHAFWDLADASNPGFREGTSSNEIQVEPGYVSVWELLEHPDLPKGGKLGHLEFVEERAVFSYRQKAQQAISTFLHSEEYFDLVDFMLEMGLGAFLRRLDIPAEDFGKALWDLDLMNINPVTIYPDFDGAAERANTARFVRGLGIRSGRRTVESAEGQSF